MTSHLPGGTSRDPLRAPRLLNAAAATLAASVVSDSATEHYRARFHNPAMFVAPLVSAAVLATAARQAFRPGGNGTIGSAVLTSAVLTGLVGSGFHLTNISRRVGGWTSSSNVFYGAPIAAPLAVTVAGVLGQVASHMAQPTRPITRNRGGLLVGALAAIGLAATAAEAAALHFRGAFQNPFMYAPVVLPPVAAVTLTTALLSPSLPARTVARTLLHLTAWLGVIGSSFHAWGVHRRMGGWHNWRQNVLAGPPLPAPPAFTGLSLAGLAAMDLLDSSDPKHSW